MPATKYIKSHSFFKHPKYNTFRNQGDIGLIKLEHPIERRERDGTKYLPNIICLSVRWFKLKGTQIAHVAKIAGSGPGLDRVKTGSIRVYQTSDYLDGLTMEF